MNEEEVRRIVKDELKNLIKEHTSSREITIPPALYILIMIAVILIIIGLLF